MFRLKGLVAVEFLLTLEIRAGSDFMVKVKTLVKIDRSIVAYVPASSQGSKNLYMNNEIEEKGPLRTRVSNNIVESCS